MLVQEIDLQLLRPPIAVGRPGAGSMLEGTLTFWSGSGVVNGAEWGFVWHIF